jgi:hypothetical protein
LRNRMRPAMVAQSSYETGCGSPESRAFAESIAESLHHRPWGRYEARFPSTPQALSPGFSLKTEPQPARLASRRPGQCKARALLSGHSTACPITPRKPSPQVLDIMEADNDELAWPQTDVSDQAQLENDSVRGVWIGALIKSGPAGQSYSSEFRRKTHSKGKGP